MKSENKKLTPLSASWRSRLAERGEFSPIIRYRETSDQSLLLDDGAKNRLTVYEETRAGPGRGAAISVTVVAKLGIIN